MFSDEQGGVEAAAGAVEAALREAGLRTERRDSGGLADIFDGMGEGLAEWLVTGPGGEQMMLQMAYFDRARKPVTMDLGPVLDLEDVVGGKVAALASRAEPRDYVDTAAALDRYSIEADDRLRPAAGPRPDQTRLRRRGAAAGPVGRRRVRRVRAHPGRDRPAARALRPVAR